ncbi:MAG: hypothetical protein U0264_00015 [Candidatus Kapaibacterium sp.]
MTRKISQQSTDIESSIQSTYDQVYYQQNRERILAQRRDNRKIYMRNYRLLMKVKSQLKKSKKRTT